MDSGQKIKEKLIDLYKLYLYHKFTTNVVVQQTSTKRSIYIYICFCSFPFSSYLSITLDCIISRFTLQSSWLPLLLPPYPLTLKLGSTQNTAIQAMFSSLNLMFLCLHSTMIKFSSRSLLLHLIPLIIKQCVAISTLLYL